jgi:predicted transcriptional regulator
MTDPLALQLSLDRLHLTRDIVVAAAASGRAFDLAEAIKAVHAALVSLADPVAAPIEELIPAVPRNKSVFPDRIISLETGQAFKSMKRHLSNLGMTPEEYRAKWGLPHDYPIVAAEYSARRSQLAKDHGLGRK